MPTIHADGSAAPSTLVAKEVLDTIVEKATRAYGESMGLVYMLTALVKRSESDEFVITKDERIAIEGWILQTKEREDEAIVLTVRREDA